MENKIKQLIFEIIYKKLNLKEIEEDFKSHNIPKKEINNPNNERLISEYFFLRNNIYLERLSEDEKEFVSLLIDSTISEEQKRLENFLEKNILKLILPETNDKYIYWEGSKTSFMAPSDAIVIAFHTIDFINGYNVEQQQYINDKLNYIQDVLGPQNNYKVAVLKYNEVPLNIL